MTLQSSTSYVRRMSDVRAWLRGLGKSAIHAGTSAILSGASTNAIEGMAPEMAKPYVAGIGLTFPQMAAVFFAASFLAALRYVNAATAPGNTEAPFNQPG